MAEKIDNEYEKVKIEHIDMALSYLLENGKLEGKHNILHADPNPKARAECRAIKYKNKIFSIVEVMRFAFLYYYGENPSEIQNIIGRIREIRIKDELKMRLTPNTGMRILKKSGMFKKESFINFNKDGKEIIMADEIDEDDNVNKSLELLMYFNQIILYGPPGTGKTYTAKKMLEGFFSMDKEELPHIQGDFWDIVQFHPSYNYEDFVRGVKVTTKDNNVVYKTENRIFGDMCRRAELNPDDEYVLIIDEINRANVSAVLGELIYALEYRDEYIMTLYAVDNGTSGLVIPKNLSIIGTMNTADRTIGQIDYAVRRRFAFKYCPPNESIITGIASDFFGKVKEIFDNHISQDYDADDVRIGHSYFMASGKQLAYQIIYQVVPILREYVKDGVLLSGAKDEINAIEKKAKILSGEEVEDEEQGESSQNRRFSWKNGERNSNGTNGIIFGMRRTVLSIVKDFVENYKKENGRDISMEDLLKWFPDKTTKYRGIKLKENIDNFNKDFFFMKEGDELKVDGNIAYVPKDWGDRGTHAPGKEGSFSDFKEEIEEKGYKIDEHPREK